LKSESPYILDTRYLMCEAQQQQALSVLVSAYAYFYGQAFADAACGVMIS